MIWSLDPKMADFWPVENVWTFVNISLHRSDTLTQLRREIVRVWREVDEVFTAY